MKQSHPDELALAAAIRTKPRERSALLPYADWLDKHDHLDRAAYLRMLADLPLTLIDGDTKRDEVRSWVTQRIALRTMRAKLEPDWLAAIHDTGFVGEVVVSRGQVFTMSLVHFGIVIYQTRATVIVAPLEKRKLKNEGSSWAVRPMLPDQSSLQQLIAHREGVRCRINDSGFSNNRKQYAYSFWDGQDVWEYDD